MTDRQFTAVISDFCIQKCNHKTSIMCELCWPQQRLMAQHEKNNFNVSAYHFSKNSKYLNKVLYAKQQCDGYIYYTKHVKSLST